jgi:PPOX class probable F420-dependent enzyme
MPPAGTPLDDERYINLETFKKDGNGVKTPVWAAPLDGRLVVFTDGTSYKVKRLRRDPRIRAAPCDVRGNVKGAWLDGTGRILDDDADKARAMAALRRKYGWQIRVLDVFSWLGRRIGRRAFLELTIGSAAPRA